MTVRARSARGQKIAEAPLLEIRFERRSLIAFVAGIQAALPNVRGTDAHGFLCDARSKLDDAINSGLSTPFVTCAFKRSSWLKLVGCLQQAKAGGLALFLDRKIRRAIEIIEDGPEYERVRKDRAESDAALKEAADRLRAEEGE